MPIKLTQQYYFSKTLLMSWNLEDGGVDLNSVLISPTTLRKSLFWIA